MNDNQKETFNYTYSAKQKSEIECIRKKYLPPEEDKMERIRKLDQGVTSKANMLAIIVGVVGALIFGAGMSCVLVFKGIWVIPGIIVGIIGLCVLGFAYPVYLRVIAKEREKIAPEILRLTDELMK